jgi:transcriptional regulator with XRE-family HTH domain
MPALSTIATLLKRLRVQSSFTQLQLGERIGVTKASISAYEKGKAYPSAPILAKLAHEFHLSIDELRFGDAPAGLSGPGRGAERAAPPPPALRELPYLPAAARAAFLENLAVGAQTASEPLACLALPDVPDTPEFAGALVVEVADSSMEPTLRPGARLLVTPVLAADWPFMPSGIYCLAYRTTFAIKRLKDNTLLQSNLLLLHADNPSGGAYPVRGDDLRAVWHVRWAVFMPLT